MQVIRNYLSRVELSNDDNQVFGLSTASTPASAVKVGQLYLLSIDSEGEMTFLKFDGPVPNDVVELNEWYVDLYARQLGYGGAAELVRVTERGDSEVLYRVLSDGSEVTSHYDTHASLV